MRFFCISKKQKKRTKKMPCTSCMAEYTRTRKEHGCPKCGFSFCGKCLSRKAVIPALSPSPLAVCVNCYNSLDGKTDAQSREKTRVLPSPNENSGSGLWEGEGLPPPSLRSLYPQQQQRREPVGIASRKAKEQKEWTDLEERLQRLNEPIEVERPEAAEGKKTSSSDSGQKKNGKRIEELEERLAALKGIPVDLVRKPRLLVVDDDEDVEERELLTDEASQLLQQAEAGIRINFPSQTNTNDRLQIKEGGHGSGGSTSSLATANSSADSSVIRKTINGIATAESSTSDLSRAASEQMYPNFAECIKKTIEDSVLAEREASEFIHRHGMQMGHQPGDGLAPSSSSYERQRAPESGEEKPSKMGLSKITRFFR